MVQKEQVKVVENAYLIDGTGRKPVRDATIIVSGNTIEEVGKTLDAPRGAEVIDAGGKTVMPGLIDAHVHICNNGDPNVMSIMSVPPGLVQLFGVHNAAKTLDAGYTMIRDMGAPLGFALSLKKGIEMGIVRGPRIIAPGRIISMTGGHADFYLPSGIAYHEMSLISDGPVETRRSARINLREGADFVKITTTGGVMSPTDPVDTPQYTLDEILAVCDEAHHVGKFVASHAHGPTGIMNALLGGVKSIEHGSMQTNETVKAMLEHDAIQVPTLVASYNIVQKGTAAGIPEWAVNKAKEIAEYPPKSLMLCHRAGVKVAAGTDAGTPFNRHGENAKELELMVAAGLKPLEAITCATKVGAEACYLGAKTGTIEKDKWADLIVVDGDPTTDIKVLQDKAKIRLVMKAGTVEVNRSI
ncbi:TPA: amidohydrolase family protein [Candidatus Bathyarchaeota archaeon]|nr:amidohydrolase family protein [Candidatus Bathyarchaeota archaeon]